jgi:hypothetical protein
MQDILAHYFTSIVSHIDIFWEMCATLAQWLSNSTEQNSS